MTKRQKLNVIKSAKKEFQTRLKELTGTPIPSEQNMQFDYLNRRDSLKQAIHFCNHLIIYLKRNNDFKPENQAMLDFIGLKDLYITTQEVL